MHVVFYTFWVFWKNKEKHKFKYQDQGISTRVDVQFHSYLNWSWDSDPAAVILGLYFLLTG